jgi:hypothetical protein
MEALSAHIDDYDFEEALVTLDVLAQALNIVLEE